MKKSSVTEAPQSESPFLQPLTQLRLLCFSLSLPFAITKTFLPLPILVVLRVCIVLVLVILVPLQRL
ncbi:hypothetical protein F8388_011395 [Cannabis sativa]|uniref:Uncharacterized protein n=1 Tax=Cannabis sativa TaxID=3483 RepID=A0A7J6EW07_CANSA|nr:hypothetical protein F8388_011395 [Cannabis sativa]